MAHDVTHHHGYISSIINIEGGHQYLIIGSVLLTEKQGIQDLGHPHIFCSSKLYYILIFFFCKFTF